MEIRRIEPDLIPPTVASDRGARVNADSQRKQEMPSQKDDQHQRRSSEESNGTTDLAAADQESADVKTYDPDGFIQPQSHSEVENHNIDFRA